MSSGELVTVMARETERAAREAQNPTKATRLHVRRSAYVLTQRRALAGLHRTRVSLAQHASAPSRTFDRARGGSCRGGFAAGGMMSPCTAPS